MRVLFVTQYFPPETGAAPARAAHFARALAAAGHEVRVVTGLPNHPSGVLHAGFDPRVREERREGAFVRRVWLYTSPRKTAGTRLWNHLTFAAGALPAALSGPRPDVVLATIPPPFLGLSAWLAALRHGAPLVLDCRDDWPRAAVALGEMRPGLAASALGALVRFLQKRAQRVLAVTPGMERHFAARGLEPWRLALITNGADTEGAEATPVADAPPAATPAAPTASAPAAAGDGALTVLYAGTHGLVHGMDVILDAAERLRDRTDLRFLLVGDGVAKPALVVRAAARGLANVEFRPSVGPAALPALIRSSAIGLATTRDHPFSGETIPVKMFDYLACGRPVVGAVRGDGADVLRASGAGVVVEPGDGAGLARALESLAADPAARARMAEAGPPFVAAHYSRRVLGARLARVLEEARQEARGRAVAPRPAGPYAALKRAADVLVALTLLAILAPLLLVIAVAIRWDSPGPSLFRQRRIGRGSTRFTIVKFRTMTAGTPDLASHLMGPGSSRVTRLGRFLRRSSLDELPQLVNVLRGEMTLVGPRPALYNQDDLIAMRIAAGVDALKPGVTGWAQIHGRDDISMAAKVEFDRWYLEHVSPATDLQILVRTPFALLSSRGVF